MHTPSYKRDLLTEISELISAHEIYMANIKDAQNSGVTKSKNAKSKEYRRSPLGRTMDEVNLNESANNKQKSESQTLETPASPETLAEDESFKFRKYKKNNEIARHCQKLLKVTAYPSVAQITLLIHQIATSTENNEIDSIRPIVLQWFRKRREYLAAKVYSVCDELMGDIWTAVVMRAESAGMSPISYDSTVEEIVSDNGLMKGILQAADLPIKDETNGVSFVKRKVKDYFTKLCSKSQ